MKKTLYLAFLMCLVPSLGFTAQKDKVTEGIYDMGGRKLIDRSVEVTGALQVDKWLELINESTPSTPASTHARFFYNNAAQKLCVVFGDGTQTCLGPGTVGGSGFLAGATQPIVYNSTTNILSATLISLSTGVITSGSAGVLNIDSGTIRSFTFYSGTGTIVNIGSGTFTTDVYAQRFGGTNFTGYLQTVNGGVGIFDSFNPIYLEPTAVANPTVYDTGDLIVQGSSGMIVNYGLIAATASITNAVTAGSGTITGNFGVRGQINQPLTISSSETVTSPLGSYITYGASLGSATLRNVASGTQCIHADSSGNLTGTGSDCGSANGQVFLASTQTFTGANTFISTVNITGPFLNNLNPYRRPVLVYLGTGTVSAETGLDGTAGDVTVLFPNGNKLTETQTKLYQSTITRTANWGTLNGMQGGLRPTETLTNNTWLSYYVVMSSLTTNTTDFVLVASTWNPTQANYATINTNFGNNDWVYIGFGRYGDNGSTGNVLLKFVQTGNLTMFYNTGTGGNQINATGNLMATTASGANLTYTYSSGVGAAQIPLNVTTVLYEAAAAGTNTTVQDSAGAYSTGKNNTGGGLFPVWEPAIAGMKVTPSATGALDIWLLGFIDGALGVGSNPQL